MTDKAIDELIDQFFPKDKRHARGQAILMKPAIQAAIQDQVTLGKIEELENIPSGNWGWLEKDDVADRIKALQAELDKGVEATCGVCGAKSTGRYLTHKVDCPMKPKQKEIIG